MSSKAQNTGVIAAGLALFSMFFGAGDLIWPLILGGDTGDKNFYAMLGLLITGVSLPLLGLLAMMLFEGDYRSFFRQTGRVPGIILVFLIQAILGPFGSTPRLITLAHATLKPYMPEFITLAVFSVLAGILVFGFTMKKSRVIDIMGLVLCPVLLLALASIVVLGFLNPHTPVSVDLTDKQSFVHGLRVGYNTLDIIASFIFAPLVLTYFYSEGQCNKTSEGRRQIFKKMVKSAAIAGTLLALMYIGLTYLASFYTPVLPSHSPEERLAIISLHLLGPVGALFSCAAVSTACLTTAIPITLITGEYIHKDFMRGKGSINVAIGISLGLSMIVANMGFMGIAKMLEPILQMLCPGLIILCILNILHKLYEMPMRKLPVFAAFAISLIAYILPPSNFF